MMRIPFNQKQEDIWSTWGHRLPSGPWRKSPVMSMGALHANRGGTESALGVLVPWHATAGNIAKEGCHWDLKPTKRSWGILSTFNAALRWLLQAQMLISIEEKGKKKKKSLSVVFCARFLSLPWDGQESCKVWAAQPPWPRCWHQSVVTLCLQTAPVISRAALPRTCNDLEIMIQETTLQSLLVLGRSS